MKVVKIKYPWITFKRQVDSYLGFECPQCGGRGYFKDKNASGGCLDCGFSIIDSSGSRLKVVGDSSLFVNYEIESLGSAAD